MAPQLWDPVSDQEGLGDPVTQVGLVLRPCKNKLSSGTVAQLVVYLTSRHKALALTPQHSINHTWWHMPIVSILRKWRQEDLGFKVIFSYISGLTLA